MVEALIEELERSFPGKAVLTVSDVCQFLGCSEKVIYNWTKRSDSRRRPPRIIVGKEIRFPKRPFINWLATEQSTDGGGD